MRLVILFLFAALMSGPQAAAAQTSRQWRARVSVSGAAQIDTERLAESITLTKYVESAALTAELPRRTLPLFDIGVAIRLAGNFGAFVAISNLTNRGQADVTAQIPHPFYFKQPRTISGRVAGVDHKELAEHLGIVYLFPSRRIDLMLSGGASFFRVDQTFVSDVTFSELYPYDTASYVDATLVNNRQTKLGYNVGADVTWKLGPQWGLGGLIRFARARVPFEVAGVDAGEVNVGGLQAGVGLRLTF
jgi:hypothetical protein